MKESEFLKLISRRSAGLGAEFPRVLVGPGDDCAVVETGGEPVLLTVDHLIEGRHFVGPLGAGTPIDLVARKAVARSVSDIAAMGGEPWASLATAALPRDLAKGDADELFDAMLNWSRRWRCPLVGGDIATLPERTPLVLTVTVLGRAHGKRGPVLRSGARVGDGVYVTGRLGGSFESGRHLRFEPRLAEAHWLCDTFGADLHAMIDVSDGLGRDAARIAEASGVSVELDAPAIPRHAEAPEWSRACADGEDYELIFTASSGLRMPDQCPGTDVRLTRIGVVRELGAGPRCMVRVGEQVTDVSELGWDHR